MGFKWRVIVSNKPWRFSWLTFTRDEVNKLKEDGESYTIHTPCVLPSSQLLEEMLHSAAIWGLDISRTYLSSLQFKLDPLIKDISSFYQNRTEYFLA